MRQVVIVARITQHDNRGPLINGADMIGDEITERSAEVGVRVHIDNITLQRYVESFLHIVGAKTLGDLADIGDEHKAAHARIKILERIDKLEHKARSVT